MVIEDLLLASRSVSLDEQNLYVSRGIRLEFRPLTTSIVVRDQPITLQELVGFLGAQKFIIVDEYGGTMYAPTPFTA